MSDQLSYEELRKQNVELKRKNESFQNKQLLFSSAFNSISETIIKEEKPEDLLENVNRILGETLQLDRILIYHVSFDKNQVIAMCEWLNAENPGITATKDVYSLDLFKFSYNHFISTQKHIESHYTNINECLIKEGSGKILHEYMNIKSLLWYPFDFDESNFYLFALNQVLEHRQWTLDEISFLSSVARQVSLVLMKIKLYEERKIIKKNERKLKILNADKDRFLTILAHDLKNPFNSLLGFSDLLIKNLHEYDRQKIEQQLKIINKTTHQTHELLEQLLLWGKLQSEKLKIEPQKFDFLKISNEVINTIENQANEKNININLFETENPFLLADPDMFKTIMRNLISNAIKFTPENGHIDIYAETLNPNEAVITVSDNGIGIENEMIPKLWDITENTSTSGTNNEKGTGLGLKLCKELIEKQGGRIWVESQVNLGSQFKLTVPIKD